jgi:L-seryl-tRNA(Ser) seleniumtransferase
MSRLKSPSLQRHIPSVDRVLREIGETELPRPVVLEVIRRELAHLRANPKPAGNGPSPDALGNIRAALDDLRRSRIQPIINATGVIIHTNFGRAPLGDAVVAALTQSAANYTNLECDLSEGRRGQRGRYVEHALAALCGAEAATVVNNCAAALVLILRHFAAAPPRNEVNISRGELVQIGGGFRIPEILEASGARLREVGTTNKTSAEDYRRALNSNSGLILKVHHSNFYMEGFVESAATAPLAAIGRDAGVPLVVDLGSGATFDTSQLGGNEHEPTPEEELAAGANLICFSGDKLLGGPQAGIIAGSADQIAALKQNPFFRALRCDKLILSALEVTADLLLHERTGDIPARAMMNLTDADLRPRARQLIAALDGLPLMAEMGTGRAQVGGGSLPRTFLPSVTLDIRANIPSLPVQKLSQRLRQSRPAVIGYIENDCLKLDLRTVFPRQDEQLRAVLCAIFTDQNL